MKFLYLKTKTVTLMTMLTLGITCTHIQAREVDTTLTDHYCYTGSIEGIYKHFKEIMSNFEEIFKNSFSKESKEKLSLTVKNLKKSELVIKQFVATLKNEAQELDPSTHLFIDILVHLADEIEIYFKQVYTVLETGLKERNATKLAAHLQSVAKEIMTDKNFLKLNDYLIGLQAIAPENVAEEIEEIRKNVNQILVDYKKESKKPGLSIVSRLRSRLR